MPMLVEPDTTPKRAEDGALVWVQGFRILVQPGYQERRLLDFRVQLGSLAMSFVSTRLSG